MLEVEQLKRRMKVICLRQDMDTSVINSVSQKKFWTSGVIISITHYNVQHYSNYMLFFITGIPLIALIICMKTVPVDTGKFSRSSVDHTSGSGFILLVGLR